MPHIRVLKLHPSAQLPTYAHTGVYGDLAADLYCVEAWTVAAGETVLLSTGIAIQLPSSHGALIEDRSGLAVRGITTLAGVIDPGFRGELKVVLTNLSPETRQVHPGDRIAQLRIVQRIEATFEFAEFIEETPRNAKGFGSSGI